MINKEINITSKKLIDNTSTLISGKRKRHESVDVVVYLEAYQHDRLYPITIRIYEMNQKPQVYVYELPKDILTMVKNSYGDKTRKPYWVDLLCDDPSHTKLTMIKHIERYDIDWIPNEQTVNYLLEGSNIILHTIVNNLRDVEIHYNCHVSMKVIIDSETAYRVDYYNKMKQGGNIQQVYLNNVEQAISSIENTIIKNLSKYPDIRANDKWHRLSKYFD